MSLNLRIFLAYFLIVGVAIYLLLNVFMSELKPGMRQSTEDSLVDMSNLLAELVTDELLSSPDDFAQFGTSVSRFLQRLPQARISSVAKGASKLRIYITDSQGIVVYDSSQEALGADYSRWNDVYLTLRGKYGARSTQSDPDNELSTVMHVAAPIRQGQQIIGVLTVAKANLSMQPFIELARSNIQQNGLWLLVVSLLAALLLSFGLTRSIRKLVSYADKISKGQNSAVPKLRETELAKLAAAIDNMRRELEGKDYVEKYVHTLTHELKSPVTAIKGASEILTAAMPAKDQARFIANISHEVQRIDDMINRLLALVAVEKQDVLKTLESVDLVNLLQQVVSTKQIQLSQQQIKLVKHLPAELLLPGDSFLLSQAIDNLLQNAIDFSAPNSQISISLSAEPEITLVVRDQGTGIPAYATDKIFERFYSLARPLSQAKSSGLGLCFVQQIAELHGGSIEISNNKNNQPGAVARLILNKA